MNTDLVDGCLYLMGSSDIKMVCIGMVFGSIVYWRLTLAMTSIQVRRIIFYRILLFRKYHQKELGKEPCFWDECIVSKYVRFVHVITRAALLFLSNSGISLKVALKVALSVDATLAGKSPKPILHL